MLSNVCSVYRILNYAKALHSFRLSRDEVLLQATEQERTKTSYGTEFVYFRFLNFPQSSTARCQLNSNEEFNYIPCWNNNYFQL